MIRKPTIALKLMGDRGAAVNGVEADLARSQAEGKTAMIVAADGEALGVIAVADTSSRARARRSPNCTG